MLSFRLDLNVEQEITKIIIKSLSIPLLPPRGRCPLLIVEAIMLEILSTETVKVWSY